MQIWLFLFFCFQPKKFGRFTYSVCIIFIWRSCPTIFIMSSSAWYYLLNGRTGARFWCCVGEWKRNKFLRLGDSKRNGQIFIGNSKASEIEQRYGAAAAEFTQPAEPKFVFGKICSVSPFIPRTHLNRYTRCDIACRYRRELIQWHLSRADWL